VTDQLNGNRVDVAFDYDGALVLARQLWTLAEHVDRQAHLREIEARDAQQDFLGTHADDFRTRMREEKDTATRVAEGLRSDAGGLAKLWKDAMDEQNRRLYGRHCDRMHELRSVAAQVGDVFTGFEYPPEPEGVLQPQPPGFLPTADFASFAL
jgi:class 3 adenylate cyclase